MEAVFPSDQGFALLSKANANYVIEKISNSIAAFFLRLGVAKQWLESEMNKTERALGIPVGFVNTKSRTKIEGNSKQPGITMDSN